MSPPKFEILAYEPTPLGMLCLRRRELLSEPGTMVTEVTLNHEFLMSSFHTASERALASVSLDLFKGQNAQVLVGGLGLGYTAAEVLTHDQMAQVFEHAPNLAILSLPKRDLKPAIPSFFQFPDLARGKSFTLDSHSPAKQVQLLAGGLAVYLNLVDLLH